MWWFGGTAETLWMSLQQLRGTSELEFMNMVEGLIRLLMGWFISRIFLTSVFTSKLVTLNLLQSLQPTAPLDIRMLSMTRNGIF